MDTRRVDLNLLVALEALLSERNVTRAAQRLHLSQPALSAQLARLRDIFGDPLFVPGQRGMTPTAKALALEAPLRSALAEVRGVVAAGRDFDPAEDRLTVRIASSDYVQAALLLDFSLALRRTAPRVRIALRVLDVPLLEGQMERGDVDLALVNATTVPESLHSRPLMHEDYVAIARQGHPMVHGPLTAEAFAQLEHIVVSPRGGGFTTPTDIALEALGLRREVVVSASSFLFVLEMVERSDLVALVPRRLVRHRADRLCILPAPVPIEGFTVLLAWHERAHHDRGQKWMRAQLLAFAAHSDQGPGLPLAAPGESVNTP